MRAYLISFKGSVQGVGFRPFVFNLALTLGLKGYVKNVGLEASVLLDSRTFMLNSNAFIKLVCKNFKVLEVSTKMLFLNTKLLEPQSAYFWEGFKILKSTKDTSPSLTLPLDLATCKDCMADLVNPNSRFFNYAFIACAKCGPRYSLINSLPYDRNSTTMSKFVLCKACKNEYENPSDRRFHAELISCENCGVSLKASKQESKSIESNNIKSTKLESKNALFILKHASTLLTQGKILAFKGLSGYALICDASNIESVRKLRALKHRQTKPIALMAEVCTIDKLVVLDLKLRHMLLSQVSPMIIAPLLKDTKNLALALKASLKEISPTFSLAITRPFSAHLDLLFKALPKDFVLCFTSANKKGAHIAKNVAELEGLEVDSIISYDREIKQSLDDSIVSSGGSFVRGVRFSRGLAPFNMKLVIESKVLICALGAHSKTSLTFLKGSECIISPYISNLDSLDNIEHLKATFVHFYKVFGKPSVLVCDANPSYESTRLAKLLACDTNTTLLEVYHHHAHFIALALESKARLDEALLAFIWDGSGLGVDLKLWGGEVFLGQLNKVCDIKRLFHFKYFYISRAESSIKDASKTAFFMLKSLGVKTSGKLQFKHSDILDSMFSKKLNLIETSSVGRIFDVVAFMLGLIKTLEYEGQSGTLLSDLAKKSDTFMHHPYPYNINDDEIDLKLMFEAILLELDSKSTCFIANRFLDTLADIALQITLLLGAKKASFGGGVFLNMLLCEKIERVFKANKLEVFFPFLPSGDYSISLGQAGYAALLDEV
ncbi:carbamoyltransferase HypF [Helicobacter sp. 11S02629-2]|uniref:carbamoyltransferase HypF n=1 Tax=Helicobacter sp. 11S02629-2 TaxID=1476195 RepID=UPI000BA6B07F|nr:carbamoyltransferase HypF [Helicobacter sp. 11S02629-2]PAF46031.1 carbamoyltransferase HypF [Helicobacter sp. 11S02629-2]